MKRPSPSESASYFQRYINLVPGNDFLKVLTENKEKVTSFLENLPAEKWNFRYQPGKWNIKEVCMHIIDTERVMAYRALRIARNDMTPMPGFEQDDYMPYSGASSRTPASIIEEYKAVRDATITLFKHFDEEAFGRVGTASNGPFSPLALGYIIAGHEIHHKAIIMERYL